MSKLVLSSCNLKLVILGETSLLNRIVNSDFLYSYIPEVKIENDNFNSICSIYTKKSTSDRIEINYPNAKFYYSNFNEKDVISLAEFLFERLRQENNIITIHGACALYFNYPILCWGAATSMGKSRLAHAIKKVGGEMVYDEKILISIETGKILGGIKKLYNHKDFYNKIYGQQDYIDIQGNIITNFQDNLPLFLYSYVKDLAKFEYSKWDDDTFEWHLYEEMCRKIRGTSRRFFNFSTPVDSLDTIELATKRINFIKKYTKMVDCYYLSGSEPDLLEFVRNYFK